VTGKPVRNSAHVVPLSRQKRPKLQWPISVVLAVAVTGLVLVAAGAFRAGTVTLACSAGVGLVLRLMLTKEQAGLLVVRRRSVDAWTLGLLGLVALVLAFWVPVPK